MVGGDGEGGKSALRVVAGAGGAGAPGRITFAWELVVEAVFPPASPEVFEPFLGSWRGVFVEGGGEESCGAEEDGLLIFGCVFEEFLDGETLSQEAHGKAVRGVA